MIFLVKAKAAGSSSAFAVDRHVGGFMNVIQADFSLRFFRASLVRITSTLSVSLWSGLCYLINLIEERPFLLFLKHAIWVFFLGVNVFPSTKCCISHSIFFHVFLCISKFFFHPFFWSSFSPRGASVSTPLLATASVVFDFL